MKLKIFLILPVVIILFCTNVYCFKWKGIAIGRTTCNEVEEKFGKWESKITFKDDEYQYNLNYPSKKSDDWVKEKNSNNPKGEVEYNEDYTQPFQFSGYSVTFYCINITTDINDWSYKSKEFLVLGVGISVKEYGSLKKQDIMSVYGYPTDKKANQDFELQECYDVDDYVFLVVNYFKDDNTAIEDSNVVLNMRYYFKSSKNKFGIFNKDSKDGCYSDDWEGHLE